MPQKKINVAVIGATGYVGLDLVYLLSKHPNVNISNLCAQKNVGKKIQVFDKRIKKKLPKINKIKNIDWSKINLVFLSLPDGESQKIVKSLIKYKNIIFIDLSADFRIENSSQYKKWFNISHNAPNLIRKSIYAISEFVKDKIKHFRIVANPGCYPTSVQLVLIPLIKKKIIKLDNIIIDAKSGYSGAGKNFKKKFTHDNFENAIHAYGIKQHKHMAEIDQEIKKITNQNVKYTFNPQLLPTFRGILSSIYLDVSSNSNIKKIHRELKTFHKNNKFIKVLKINSEIGTGNVINTNYCEISVCETRYKNRVVIFSAIDNLLKGASGQAIQNMNLIYGFNEQKGFK